MKILFLIERLGIGGGKERRLIELLKGLLRDGVYQPEVALIYEWELGVEVLELGIPIYNLEKKNGKDIAVFFRMHKLLKKVNPAIIHSFGTLPSLCAIPSAKLLKIKLINGNITGAPDNLSCFSKDYICDKISFIFSDQIVSNSKAGIKVFQPPKSKTHCIYNGIDVKRISNLKGQDLMKKELGIQTRFIVGMVARFSDEKDYKTYLQAAFQVLQDRDDVTFLAIGEGQFLEEMQAMVPTQFREKIIFPGFRNDVESLVNIFDIGVLATYTEGISNSIIEYMALNKPVVATDGGGTAELVEEGITGLLVKPQLPKEMAQKINYLLEHPPKAKQMGLKGRKRIEENFSLAAMTQEYIRLYQRLEQ